MTASHETTTALARDEGNPSYQGLTMVVSPAEAQRRLLELQAFVKSAMVKDADYGVIPGTDKDSLFQSGAQKLAEMYGFAHRFEAVEVVKDWERNFFYFEYRCVLTSRRDGGYVGEGIGSCNSRESKYAYRWVFESEIPLGVNKSNLVSESKTSRKTGKPYTRFRLPNEDLPSIVNTLQKMAAKRSYVHAVIAATRSSGLFTQDVEDLPNDVFGKASKERSWDVPEARGEVVEQPAKDEATAPARTAKVTAKEEGGAGGDPVDVYAQREAELRACSSDEELKRLKIRLSQDVKAKRLTLDQVKQLASLRDELARDLGVKQAAERKAESERMSPPDDDFDQSFAGPPVGQTPPADAKPGGTTRDFAEEARVLEQQILYVAAKRDKEEAKKLKLAFEAFSKEAPQEIVAQMVAYMKRVAPKRSSTAKKDAPADAKPGGGWLPPNQRGDAYDGPDDETDPALAGGAEGGAR